MNLALLIALLAPPAGRPIDCREAARVAVQRFADDAPARAASRLAEASVADSGPSLELRARAGSPRPNMIDRAGVRLNLPPPGTAAQFERVGKASARVETARLQIEAVSVTAAAQRAHLAVREAAGELKDAKALHAMAQHRAELRMRQAKVGVIPGLKATQAEMEVLAARDGVLAAQAKVASARAELSRWAGSDQATGVCAVGAPPERHPILVALDADDALLTARVAEEDLGADLWPDFIEAAWDDDNERYGRGLLSIGIEIPLAGEDRAGLAEARARARRAQLVQSVEADVTLAKARLSAAQAHQTALAEPLPAHITSAPVDKTIDGLALQELILRAKGRRRAAAFAVEAAQIDLAEALGTRASP